MDLPYQDERTKAKNSLYWRQPNDFWKNLLKFLESIIKTSPSTAMKIGQPMLQNTIKLCLEGLQNKYNFVLPEELSVKIAELQKKIIDSEQQNQIQTRQTENPIYIDEEPLEDFRLLPIIPNRYYLMREPFLRRNIIEGAYKDVDHYLDIQFRLLLEDCYGPLRKGLLQYMVNPNQHKYDNIRVYKNVRLLAPYVSRSKIGCLIQIDKMSNKGLFKVNWKYSKRLLYGSLLLLSNDNFNRFVVATIIDRDTAYLSKGQLPIALVNIGEELHLEESYTMIESDVYFEPYYHVLKVLHDPSFPVDLTMQNYIVKAEPSTLPPEYLNDSSCYKIDNNKFFVLQKETWPNKDELGLNNSQYEALHLALTNEIAVIQGPPGTGKTYLGVKIAETFLQNLRSKILVICYTNHALDQFLEHILKYTRSIVRIGGQSANKTLENFNIKEIRKRRTNNYDKLAANVYYDQKQQFNTVVLKLKRLQERIESLDYGILSHATIKMLIPESKILEKHYKHDPLNSWLFENMTYVENIEEEYETGEIENNEIDEDKFDMRSQRVEINLDDDNFSDDDANKDLDDFSFALSSNVDQRNIIKLPAVDRWYLYFTWINKIKNMHKEKIVELQYEFTIEEEAYEDARMYYDLQFIRNVKVIGVTTTGAARLQRMFKQLKPAIVIVEEAAEVLEQHIVATLGAGCKHLVLIGDHQQLRPSASYMKLAKRYNLEVSLFERLVKNNIPNVQLNVQHRMRPEIASLIAPHIYRNLQNHPSVEEFPPVRGMTNNLFFYTHNYKEEKNNDSLSRSNTTEADVALSLANYLMQQDYNPEDITILATYSGQMFYMRKQRPLYSYLSQVKITVVDNYQGEESKIIILSLVRNNIDNKIGFLAIENRICVALSRAREGMYILGNIDILKQNTDLWCKIATTLENNGSLGTEFRLRCENHPETITAISKPEDFNAVPEGGCLLRCKYKLRCGHSCTLMCHGYDILHLNVVCHEMCKRIICELNHLCPLPCKEDCDKCKVPMRKRLPCEHVMTLPCWQEPNEHVKCTTIIPVTLPICGHEGEKFCYLDMKDLKCTVKCVYRVEKCGHVCTRDCHIDDDPDHEKYVCVKPCARAKANCSATLVGDRGNHQCRKKCYESCDDCDVKVKKKRSTCTHTETVSCSKNVDDTPCPKKCRRTLPCGHYCPKKCFEECGNCTVKVTKVIPECGHNITMQCQQTPTSSDCTNKCERILPCGHVCTGRCNEPCDPMKCTALTSHDYETICGHKTKLPCNVLNEYIQTGASKMLLRHCIAPCSQTLECDHICSGTCSECYQGRLHVSCKETCHKQNICGHRCEEPCNQLCPPCKKKCEIKCIHSLCSMPCGVPCTPCQEPCTRACPHSACVNRCGEMCSRTPCDEPCGRKLRCGHPCRGLCGERCPQICAHCHPDTFPVDFLGDEYDENAKFIQLEDCCHVLEVEDMDNLMMGDSETISIRTCPFCRIPIINTQRYKNRIMHMFTTDINPIKQRVFGNKRDINNKKKDIMVEYLKVKDKYKQLLGINKHYEKAFELGMKFEKIMTLLNLNTKSVYLEILDIIGDYYMKYHNANFTLLKNEMISQIEVICDFLCRNITHKISRQQQNDIGNELNRINAIIQLSEITCYEEYLSDKDRENSKQSISLAVMAINSWKIFDNNKVTVIFKKLQPLREILERQMVVKVMDMKAGHWYKCPNGHFYCIGECGGAMEIGKCPECKEMIGGQNHRLLSNNQHAGELDGSRFAAWSEEYNNLGNFNLDD
ncbi:NFX1-type zinc finger-containing protein 1-like [Aphomia sociella]